METDLKNQLDQADNSLRKGNPGEAFSIYKSLLEDNQENETIRYGAALSAAKVGSVSAASGYLKYLIEQPSGDSKIYNDSLSLLGRIEKDRYSRLTASDEKKRAAMASAQAYERAYQDSSDYYPGLNAASMYKLAGDKDRSARIVEKVSKSCNKLIHDQHTDDHWLAATMGELALLENNQSQAIHWYSLTRKLIGDAYGEISSMRRQLILLREVIEIDDEIFSVLDIPTVVTMTGHMIDAADRQEPRFPQYIEKRVRDELDKLLSKINAGFGYCSAACGADIIFIEAMLARGAEVHINLPFDQEDFLNISIRFAGEEWEARYFDVISRCTSVSYSTKEGYLGDDTLFEYNADVITGKTMIRSRQLNVIPEFVAIYDSSLNSISGGSKATALSWQKLGHSVRDIDLKRILATEKVPVLKPAGQFKQPEIVKNEISREIHTMLFADFVGFSKMGEAQTPQFFLGLLKEVSKLIESRREGLQFCNTWGDGLFMVFDNLIDAARFSLQLRELVADTNWEDSGLPEDTSIRIAMHTGPVYEARDPIINSTNYFGSHVNRAARMEPVTTPGSVFVSEQSAALIATLDSDEFSCDFLGIVALEKEYGENPLYRLRRGNEVE